MARPFGRLQSLSALLELLALAARVQDDERRAPSGPTQTGIYFLPLVACWSRIAWRSRVGGSRGRIGDKRRHFFGHSEHRNVTCWQG
jgi:hypothetical protein